MCSIQRQAFKLKLLYIHPGFAVAGPMGCCPVWRMNCMCVCQCVMLTIARVVLHSCQLVVEESVTGLDKLKLVRYAGLITQC